MFFKSKAKHVKNPSIQKTTSLGLVGLLVAAGLIAVTSPSQAAPVVEDIYCQEGVTIFNDVNDTTPDLEIAFGQADGYEASFTIVRLDSADVEAVLFNPLSSGNITSVNFFNGQTAEIRSASEVEPGILELKIYISEVQVEPWPLTLNFGFGSSWGETDIVNTTASFTDFRPCNGTVRDAETENTDDGFDTFGEIKILSGGVFIDVRADSEFTESPTVVRKTVQGGLTTFNYVTQRYSDAAEALVDVKVGVLFLGNTVKWYIEAYLADTLVPAEMTFYIEGNLGSDETTEFATSNGMSYSTDRGDEGDPVLVYDSDSGAPATVTEDAVRFAFEDTTLGYVEISLIGYQRCATDEAIMAAVEALTFDYKIAGDLPDVTGTCSRECQPNTEAIERGPGQFDIGGIPLCFDSAFESTDAADPKTLRDQEVNVGPDLGSQMVQGNSVEYQNVAQGGNSNLHAIVTLSAVYGQQDDEITSVDYFSHKDNGWIKAYLDYASGEEDRYVEYTVVFFVSGDLSRTPVSVSNLNLSVYDVDDYQFFSAEGVDTYSLAEDTFLTATASGAQLRVSENEGEESSNGDESRVSMTFKEADSFVFRMGITDEDTTNGNASFGLDFTGGNAWGVDPVVEKFKPGRTNSEGISSLPAPKSSLVAKKVINTFAPESPKLLKAQKAKIKNFLKKYPELSSITCTGFTAGPVKRTDKILAKQRASNVCAYIERIKPEIKTKVAGKTPGLPLSPLSRKVAISGFSITT
jgi:hypothetical protein